MNGAAAPYPTAVADASGNFSWTPPTNSVAPGNVTIDARAVDDDANGNPIYGSWLPLTFTYQAVAPPAGTIIGSLTLADNVGPSSSALESTDGSISGQVIDAPGSTESVAAVTVEIDLADSGQAVATVSTDSHGNFSYTPPVGSLPQGTVKIQVRTADQAAAANASVGNGSVGNGLSAVPNAGGTYNTAGTATFTADASGGFWTSLSFVLSSTPSASSVQSAATTLAANLSAAAQAATNGQASSNAASAALSAAETAAATTYNTALSGADAAQQSSAATAAANYNSALASAQETYKAAMAQAAGNFNSELNSYSGDKTSYDAQPYQWPDAPPALPGPDQTAAGGSVGNGLSAVPPVEAPTFTGPQFDPTQDATYTAAIAADQAAYDGAVNTANDAYGTAVNQAATTEKNSVNTAKTVEQQAFATADQAYELALAATNPFDLTAAYSALNGADQAATDAFTSTVAAANATEVQAMDAAGQAYLGSVHGADAAHDAAFHAADNQLAYDLLHLGDGIQASTPAEEQAALVIYQKRVSDDYNKWAETRLAAMIAWSLSVDAAALAYAQAIDAAAATDSDAVANAADVEQKACDAAQVTLQTSVAQHWQWDAKNRADADLTRQQAHDLAEYNFGSAVALATQTYSDAVASARQTRDNAIADALETQEQDDAAALEAAGQKEASGVGLQASGADELAWVQYQGLLAEDQATYDTSDATAQHTLAYQENAAAYTDAVAVDQANETRDVTIARDRETEQDTEAQATDTRLDGQADNDFNKAQADAVTWQAWEDDQADANQTFDLAAIAAEQTYYDTLAADAKTAYDASATIEHLGPATAADATASAAIMTAWTDADAAANHTYVYAQIGANLSRDNDLTGVQETYTDSLSGNLNTWYSQNDTLLGTDEKAVGAALATQDEDDTGARDLADETAANLAKTEVDTDAQNEQTYNNNQAVEQQTQDVADSEAQQTFEETEADDYMNALNAWVQSLTSNPQSPTPLLASATEQYQQAVADDTWVHSETAAQVTDVQAEDAAQVTWADSVDAQSEQQTVSDAAAMAAAIVSSDQADALRAATDDAAWTTEVQQLADATTSYDQADAAANDVQTSSDAAALKIARDGWDTALGNFLYAQADALETVTTSGSDAGLGPAIAAASLAQYQAEAAASVVWANATAGDEQTYMKSLADAKGGSANGGGGGWVAGMVNAEAGYVSAAATAGAVETTSDANTAATMDETLALDEGNFEISLGQDDNTLDATDGTDQETLVHAEDECDAADEVGYAQANATYQNTLWSSYAAQLQSLIPNPQSPTPESVLDQYYANVALHQSQEISTDGADLVSEVNQITQADVTLGDEQEAASVDQTSADDTAQQTETTTLVPQEETAVDNADTYLVQAATADANAEATYETSTADAIAQFYIDKGTASRVYDYAAADAGTAMVTAMAQPTADYNVQVLDGETPTVNLGADAAAADAAYNSSISAARVTEITSYGQAEINEATSIGAAQVALATALGNDEVTLTQNETQVSDTLETETLADDDTLNNALTADGQTDDETNAQDESNTTTTEGGDEITTQQSLANVEATTAANLAGDQATYAIAMAQIAAGAAASFAQANPGNNQAQFASLYAQGYVTWLTDLKSAFVTNATAIATAAGNDEVALVTSDVNLADQESSDNVTNVDTQDPQSANESQANQATNDTYQQDSVDNVGTDEVSSAQADQTQMLDLANAAATYIVASATADKQHAIDNYNAAPDGDKNFQIAVANARQVLADSQADADQARIADKATADKTYLTSDAQDWQTMSNDEAQTSDQYALTGDSETQTADDTQASQESGTLTAQATADQTQGNADASAEAAFQIAQANETSTVWNDIVSSATSSGLPGLPWMKVQAGIAGAEATWAVTAAANYQTCAAALGTAEIAYATSDASQFDTELTTIDAADKTAADASANTDLTLSTTLTNDEATFEETLATAGAAYQIAVGQANQNYRKGTAQAQHDLTVETAENNPNAQADYNNEMAAALTAKNAAIDAAYAAFATSAGPAITLQGTDDANAQETDTETNATTNFNDIEGNNSAVNTYDDQESADFAAQQTADATALNVMQQANANGNAAAIVAYDQANPSPWADLANWQAAAQATQQIATAIATQTRSVSEATAQQTDEQAQSDATTAKDDAQAQAEETKADSDAQTADAEAVAEAAAADAVFTYLPDILIAPTDGPTPVLTPDYLWGYEANEYYVGQTAGTFLQASIEMGIGWVWFRGAPSFAGPGTSGPYIGDFWVPYAGQLNSYLGDAPGDWNPALDGATGDLTGTSAAGAGGMVYGNPIVFAPVDMVRGGILPEAQNYAPAMHFTGGNAELLDLENTPSNVGPSGYSQSPLPTTLASTQLANPAPAKSQSFSLEDVPAQSGVLKQEQGQETPATPTVETDNSAGRATGEDQAGVTIGISVWEVTRDPAEEAPDVKDESHGEPEIQTGDTQQQLVSADKAAEQPVYGPPANGVAGSGSSSESDGTSANSNGSNTDSSQSSSENSAAPTLVLIVSAAQSPNSPLQLGGDPNSPFTMPMSDGQRADQWLMNLGLTTAADPVQSVWATGPVQLPPDPQPPTDQENAIQANVDLAKKTGNRFALAAALNDWERVHGRDPLGMNYKPPTYDTSFEDGVVRGAAMANAKLVGGAAVVGVVTLIFPPAGLALGLVGILVFTGSTSASAASRANDGQTLSQSLVGGVLDNIGVSKVVAGVANVDVMTWQNLGLNDFQRGEALGGGAIEVASIGVPLAAAGTAGVVRVGGRVLQEVGSYQISIADASTTASMAGLGGVRLRRVASENAEMPELLIEASRYPGMAENISHAQRAGHPTILTFGGDVEANRAAALAGVPRIARLSRDEYPFASVIEGGAGSWVGHIDPLEQSAQGGLLKAFYEKYELKPGMKFIVIVISKP